MSKLLTPTRKVWLAYGLLALFVMVGMLLPGYVLTLDMIFTPHIAAPAVVSNGFVWQWGMHILNFFLPGWAIQKIIIIGTLLLAGVGMHRLVRSEPGKKFEKTGWWMPYMAGILYVVNPFTYERWMAGHYLFLAGYALLPWLVQALFWFVSAPSRRGAGNLALLYTAMAIVSIHMLVLSIIVGVVVGVVYVIKGGQRRNLVKWGAAALATFAFLNIYWLWGVVSGSSEISQTISHFDARHLEAFSTVGHPSLGVVGSVLGMTGFWLERYHRYVLPNASWLWVVMILILLVLVGFGVRTRWRKDRAQTASLVALGTLGLVMGMGAQAPLIGGLIGWVLLHVPVLQGFREPQKFVALLAFGYCFFVPFGAQAVGEMVGRKYKGWSERLVPLWLLLPFALTPLMPLGFVGQLKPVQYPAAWSAFNTQLEHDRSAGRVLFLPWHQYMSFDFNRRVIANPAPQFFSASVISGDNAEFGTVYRDTVNPESDYVEGQILGKAGEPGLGGRLSTLGVKYVLLASAPDTAQYEFLDREPELKKIVSDPSLTVYENTVYHEVGLQ